MTFSSVAEKKKLAVGERCLSSRGHALVAVAVVERLE